MATRRQRRVSELVHRELGLILMQEMRDPRASSVTITEVEVTADLLLARVYYTVLGDKESKDEAQAALEHGKGFLRSALAARVELRFVPDLVFEFDSSPEYGRRIDELLEQIKIDGSPDDE